MPNTKQQTRRSSTETAPQQAGAVLGDASRNIGGSPAQSGPVNYRAAWSSGHAMQQAAGHAEEAGRRLSEVVQQAAENTHAFMALPATFGSGLLQMHQAAAGLIGGVMQTNLRLAQGMFQAIDSGAVIDMQRHYVRDHVGAFTESAASIVRAAHHAADEAWRPLEARLEQRLRQLQQGKQQAQQHARRVADIMSPGARVASPEDTVQLAARIMHDDDVGALPVGENDRLVGMVTDHDVAALVADARDPAQTKVREVMTPDVRYVFEDEEPHHAALNMAEQHVVRLPVLNRSKRLVGVVSLGDLTAEEVIASAEARTPGVRMHKDVHSGMAAE